MSETVKNQLKNLSKLLQTEKDEDFTQYRAKVQALSLNEKRKKGYCWYPIHVDKSGYTFGNRAFVIVHFQKYNKYKHHFRPGKTVSLFCNDTNIKHSEQSGVIHYVDKHKMKIILNTTDLPIYLSNGLIGVELLFDERSYIEMEQAIERVTFAQTDRLAELREIILGDSDPIFATDKAFYQNEKLNPSQNAAVNAILDSYDLTVVHGPPGTGKTTTLVAAIKALSKKEKPILVCAPSNAAVDLLTEKLAAEDLDTLRVGNISRIDESIMEHTLEVKISKNPENARIKKVRIEAADYRKKASKFKRSFGATERNERKELRLQAKELTEWANQLEDRLTEQIVLSSDVITCTLVGSNNKILKGYNFDTAFIDEATQALEPANWIPIIKSKKVVLAGDPFQLSPTIKSFAAKKEGLGQTLIEKCILANKNVHLLDTQYRMNKIIMEFSNQYFYGGKLSAHESNIDHHILPDDDIIEYIDTAGTGFEETQDPETLSRFNKGEVDIFLEHIYQLAELIPDFDTHSIGIISPYKEQTRLLKRTIEQDPVLLGFKNIDVDTVDSFQGQERDIIYILLVRSNAKGEIGFLNDYRRMNVAMTRARKKLIIIGDSATIGNDPFYQKFIDYVEKEGAYRTAWEYMQ